MKSPTKGKFLINPDHIVCIYSENGYTKILTDIPDENGNHYVIQTAMQAETLREIIDNAYE